MIKGAKLASLGGCPVCPDDANLPPPKVLTPTQKAVVCEVVALSTVIPRMAEVDETRLPVLYLRLEYVLAELAAQRIDPANFISGNELTAYNGALKLLNAWENAPVSVSRRTLDELICKVSAMEAALEKIAFNGMFKGGGGSSVTPTPAVGGPFLNGVANRVLFDGGGTFAEDSAFTWNPATDTLTVSNLVITVNAGFQLTGQVDGAGVGGGTLLNAPVAGNPRFWVPIMVNAIPGHFPVW